jgi:GNAT superfamily N-acetyltransferase
MSFELEAVERAELQALHGAAPEEVRNALGLACDAIGTALVSLAGALPASAIVVNRAIGLGVTAPADRETVDAILERYRRAGVRRYFVHVHPAAGPPGLRDWLLAQGLERTRAWVKFTRGRESPPAVATSVEVRRARPEDMAAFSRIAAVAFDLGDAATAWLSCLDRAIGWRAYVGLIDGEIVGTGGLFVQDGIGWLDFGATAPQFRGRGSQSALLRKRIMDALDLGCRVLATATGEAVAGDPQHSYKNIKIMGFREAYVRENYAPPKAA